ncbi:MAG: tetratricopeptide repeat protein [Candidatus Cloacimonetes bacterium]|nr:tetratricopeptide repeat protein [Candidatus Cloacimonadota bacterium]
MRKIVPLFLLAFALASCIQVNTLYNARKYFAAAQARPLNANGRPNNQAVEEYTKTIQKCGIILSNETRDSRSDDALFLMARALYYKGNSAFQAKDQFESLIKGWPDSPFFGEAHIYLARVLRDINRKEEAVKVLQEFILDPQHKKLHSRALLTLAEFNIADKDYLQAQYWLGRIITDYPKSSEYREAFFIYGQNYFIQQDYQAALEEFQKIAKDGRIPQAMKLDARYYVALNQFLLGDHEQSRKTLQKLLKDELRPEKISQARVLQARLMLARGDAEQGLAEIEDISKVYPRTLSSAEAQYRLGEHFFYQAMDLEKAGTAYNKVRTEFANSELAEPGQQKATAVNQLKARVSFDPTVNLQQFVDYHISAAENYFNVFSLPDSALLMYQRIIDSRDSLVTLRDSVAVELAPKQGRVDSLSVALAALPEPVMPDSTVVIADSLAVAADSLAVADSLNLAETEIIKDLEAGADSLNLAETEIIKDLEAGADSLLITELAPDLETVADSLNLAETEIIKDVEAGADSLSLPQLDPDPDTVADSLDLAETEIIRDLEAGADSLAITELAPDPETVADSLDIPESAPDPEEQRRQLQQQLTSAETELKQAQDRLQALDTLLQRYDRELIPLALFSQANIHSRTGPDRPRMEAIYADMLARFPNNKYTNALEDLLAGETVRLVDPAEEAQELLLDRAFGLAESAPDSMLVILNELAASDYLPISLKANYRLGWYHTFELPDTTAARPYLDKVLELERGSEYASVTSRFYDGSKFKLHKFDELVDSLAVADSLQALADSTAAADSLKPIEGGTPEPEPEPEIKPQEDLQEPEQAGEGGAGTEPLPSEPDPVEPKPDEPTPDEPTPDEPAPDEETPLQPPEDLPDEDGGSELLKPDAPSE